MKGTFEDLNERADLILKMIDGCYGVFKVDVERLEEDLYFAGHQHEITVEESKIITEKLKKIQNSYYGISAQMG